MNRLQLIELLNAAGIRFALLESLAQTGSVLVTPELGGRVLALDLGESEPLHVYINPGQITRGFDQDGQTGWNNFGGAERLWFAPEGGTHGFMFADTAEQTYDRYRFQPAHHRLRFTITDATSDSLRMQADAELTNASGTRLQFALDREISHLPACPYVPEGTGAPVCGFETRSRVRNTGPQAWDWQIGPLALWTLGQFLCRPTTVIIVPLRAGDASRLGPPVCTEYFKHLCPGGVMPEAAWHVGADHLLLNGMGLVQTKLDIGPRRSLGRMAALELDSGLMTIVDFEQPSEAPYAASYWLPYAGNPREGAAISLFSLAGNPDDGAQAPFFELESFSPAWTLPSGADAPHVSRTWLTRPDPVTLRTVLKTHFNISLEALQAFQQRAASSRQSILLE